MTHNKLVVLFPLIFLSLFSFSQKTTEFGLLVGRSYYLGEINPTTHVGNDVGNLAIGAAFRFNLNKRYSLKATILQTTLKAKDVNNDLAFNQMRNAEFENDLTEGAATIEFNFLPYETGDKDFFFSPYLFVGFAIYSHSPKLKINEAEYPNAEEGRSTHLSFPFGTGIKVSLARKVSLSFEWGFRKTSNDHLDGLPNREFDIFELSKNYDNDWYSVNAFMLTYKLSDKGPCPAYNF